MTLAYQMAAETISRQTQRTLDRSNAIRNRARNRQSNPRSQQGEGGTTEPLVCPTCAVETHAGLNCPDCSALLVSRSYLGAMSNAVSPNTPTATLSLPEGEDDDERVRRAVTLARRAMALGLTSLGVLAVSVVLGIVYESLVLTWLVYPFAAGLAALAVRYGRSIRWQRAFLNIPTGAYRCAELGILCSAFTLFNAFTFVVLLYYMLFLG